MILYGSQAAKEDEKKRKEKTGAARQGKASVHTLHIFLILFLGLALYYYIPKYTAWLT